MFEHRCLHAPSHAGFACSMCSWLSICSLLCNYWYNYLYNRKWNNNTRRYNKKLQLATKCGLLQSPLLLLELCFLCNWALIYYCVSSTVLGCMDGYYLMDMSSVDVIGCRNGYTMDLSSVAICICRVWQALSQPFPRHNSCNLWRGQNLTMYSPLL